MAINPTGFTIDAILCDSAVTAEGKLYMQGGGWNLLGANSFPFNQPRLGLAVVIGVPYTATNQNHTLTIHLENEDGARFPLGPPPPNSPDGGPTEQIGAQFNIGRPPTLQSGDSQTIPFAVNIDQLEFDSPGGYTWVIGIDGTPLAQIPFRIMGSMPIQGVAG